MLLITAGKYIEAELASEFGKIPPCFLPIGNKRLFEHQLAAFKNEKNIFLSIPTCFSIDKQDKIKLEEYRVTIIPVPMGLSLGRSILHCLEIMGNNLEPLKILHGDTLISPIESDSNNIVSVASTNENYDWAVVTRTQNSITFSSDQQDNDTEILSGYFCFSSPKQYKKSLLESNEDFIDSLNDYSKNYIQLKPRLQSDWLDFGHIHTYFSSKSKLTTQRSFNNLKITKRTVTKSSRKHFKMECESDWYKKTPPDLNLYTPKLLSTCKNTDTTSYTIEYLYLSTLNELFVFGKLPSNAWDRIFDSCNEFLEVCKAHPPETKLKIQTNSLFREKTMRRIEEFSEKSSLDIHAKIIFNGEEVPSIHEQITHCCKQIRDSEDADIGIMHGDFCFSNILYDFRAQSILCIDPRGHIDEETKTIYGDRRYDVAKFYHSIIGDYDLIIAGRYKLHSQDNTVNFNIENPRSDLKDIIINRKLSGYSANEIFPIMINLFFSMLPLHSDNKNRQQALLANAVRLYKEYYL